MKVDFRMPCDVCGETWKKERDSFYRGTYLGGENATIPLPPESAWERMRHCGKGTAPRDAAVAHLGVTRRAR